MKKITQIILILTVVISFVYARDYYPLAVGNYWVHVHNTSVSYSNPLVTYDSTVIVDEASFQGMQLFTCKSHIGSSPDSLTNIAQFFIASKDNRVYHILDTTDFDTTFYEAKHVYTDGEQWNNGAGNLVVEFLDEPVTVDAGTFDSCFHVYYEFCLAETYFDRKYAPDVGMIYAKRNFGNYTITLLRYKISSTSISESFALTKQSEKICLYPQTVNSHIIIRIPTEHSISSIDIYDINGKCIDSFTYVTNNIIYWNTKRVSSAVYIIHAYNTETSINQLITVRK